MRIVWLVFFVLISSLAFSNELYVTYEAQIDGAAQFKDIYPIQRSDDILRGFVACDSVNSRVYINWFRNDSAIWYPVVGWPLYCLAYQMDTNRLRVYYIRQDTAIFERTPLHIEMIEIIDSIGNTVVAADSFYYQCCDIEFYRGIYGVEFGFRTDQNNMPQSILFSGTVHYHWEDPLGPNSGEDYVSTTLEHSLDLSTNLLRSPASIIRDFDIDGQHPGGKLLERRFSKTGYYDPPGPQEPYGTYIAYSEIAVLSANLDTLFGQRFSFSDLVRIFTGNFSRSYPGDEVICQGRFRPLDDTLREPEDRTTCYSLSTGGPKEIWSQQLPTTLWDFSVQGGSLLFSFVSDPTGIEVVSINPTSGEASSWGWLTERPLTAIKPYQSVDASALFNFMGRNADTIFNYRVNYATDVEDPETSSLPKTAFLSDVYPNPFNPSTSFTLSLPRSGEVKVGVFNLLGQEVEVIHDGPLSEGTHTFTWRGAKASGIYLLRAQFDGSQQTRKMVLVK